jgi:hypothetical protein
VMKMMMMMMMITYTLLKERTAATLRAKTATSESFSLSFSLYVCHTSPSPHSIHALSHRPELMAAIKQVIDDFDGHFFYSKRGYLACRSESLEWKRRFDHVSLTVHSCAVVSIMTF